MTTKDTLRKGGLIVAILLIVGTIYYFEQQKPKVSMDSTAADISAVNLSKDSTKKADKYPLAKNLVGIEGYINAQDGFNIDQLIGKKVIMVDFWTYSCINCQRTLPYLDAWYQEYEDQGLEIIGVHTPEFEFEKSFENVQKAVEKYNIEYPVVLDNNYGTWSAYQNRYWPRKYLIDIDGYVVYDHIGEGGYEETEKKIQELLKERKVALGSDENLSQSVVSIPNAESPQAETPEIYFGSARNSHLGNGTIGQDGVFTFNMPEKRKKNSVYLSGSWNIQPEYAVNQSNNAKITLPYKAKSVYMVMHAEKPVKVLVKKDGKFLTSEAGEDIIKTDGESFVMVSDSRLYSLIVNDPQGVSDHELELTIESPGVEAFTFTFG